MGNAFMVDRVQKAVVRVPFCATATPQPLHRMPLPMPVAKALAAFACRGWLGLLQCMFLGLLQCMFLGMR